MPTREQIDAARAEAMKTLSDDKSSPPIAAPAPVREVPLVFEDDVARWKREADEASARRQHEREKLQRQSRTAEQARTADRAAVDVLTAEVVALRHDLDEQVEASNELARGLRAFADAVDGKLGELGTLLKRLHAGEASMRARHEEAYSALRAEFAAERSMHARELALVTKQLAETQTALARAEDRNERKRDREQLASLNDGINNVVTFMAERAERDGAA